MLRKSGFTDITTVKNEFGNGVDIIARAPDGTIVKFEVKTKAFGKAIGDLNSGQKNPDKFCTIHVEKAKDGLDGMVILGGKRGKQLCNELLEKGGRNSAIGVDLPEKQVLVGPWAHPWRE
jgi:hypothetical protein